MAAGRAILVCPEEEGGLGTPRPRASLVGGDGHAVLRGEARVVTEDGRDVTAAFVRGAQRAASLARAHGARRAVLTARSPSCGCGTVWKDGALFAGDGVTAARLIEEGMEVQTRE